MVKSVALAAGLAPLIMSSAALAQTTPANAPPTEQAGDATTIPDVIVTASKQGAQALQKTPIAISVVDSTLLEAQGLNNIKDISTYVPNLAVSRNISASIVSIRGIGSNGGEPSVTTQIDGVYIANSIAFTDFFDVGRVEVLRGPQGTLYGRNATGGAINFISKVPSSIFEGKVRLGYGNYNAREASAYLSGPFSDTVRASLAVDYRGHDAYFHNIAPGGQDIGSGGSGGFRTQLLWQPSANFDATTRGDYSVVRQHFESYDHLLLKATLPPFVAPANLANSLIGSYRDVALDGNQFVRGEDGGISEDMNWRISPHFSLNSITAWRRSTSTAFNDNDATEGNFLYFRSTTKLRQISQELNLKYAGDHLNAVAGIYYFDLQSAPGSFVQRAPNATQGAFPNIGTQSFAVFAQADYEIVDNLKLILGARYTTERNSLDQTYNATTAGVSNPGYPIVYSIARRDDAFTPKFGLTYQANGHVFLYASATKGFKSGGFNGQATDAATAGYKPELIWSYEGGIKSDWFDKRLRLNLTGFYYDYTDLQVRQLLGPGLSAITNAASAKVKGVELELVAKPSSALQISASGSWLDAKYGQFDKAPIPSAFAALVPTAIQTCTAAGCTINAAGNYLSDAPKWSGLIAVDYSPLVGNYQLLVHVDQSYRSSRYFDVTNIPISRQGAYGLLNASIGFGPKGSKSWRVEVYGRNLTDAKYYQTISGNGVTPGGIVGDPRTYGIRLNYAW